MQQDNLHRMIRLADEFFGTRKDPAQISVSPKEMKKLLRIHPNTMTEKRTANGPIAWMLVLPTTQELKKQFIKKKITERELLEKTPLNVSYETIYLCSALVLPEYRRKGLATKLLLKAIKSIRKEHPITSLFYWEFSSAGKKLSHIVAEELHLPLSRRSN
jgi:ribosomal protein S18 acetylase RimI-like enzyme